MRKIITIFLILINITILFPIVAQAGFGVSPPYINEHHLLPGSHYTTTIYMSQSDPSNLTYCEVTIDAPEIEDWITINPSLYFPFWVNQYPMEVIIDVPENASLGSYSGYIRVRKLVYDEPGGQVVIVLGARVDVSLTVIDYNYTYYEVDVVATPDHHIGEDMTVLLTVDNKGNTYAGPPYVIVEIYDISNINLLETINLTNWTAVPPFTRTTISKQCQCNQPCGEYWNHVNIPGESTWLVHMRIVPFPVLYNPIPQNGSTMVPPMNTVLSWSCGGVFLTYDVYFGAVNPPPQIISNQSENSYVPILNYSTTYYWKIIAWDYLGGNCIGPLWSFTTATPDIVYVDDDYTSSTPGWQYDHFDVIQDGIDAVEGSTVYVFNGTYYENVVVDKTINLTGEDKNGVIIDGGGVGDVVYISADFVNISGFTVTGATGENRAGIYLATGTEYCNISNNTASNNYYGICLCCSGCNNTLINNTACNNEYEGIALLYSSNNNILKNNNASNNMDGISLYSSSEYNTLINNIASSSGQRGIYVGYSSNYNTLTNNVASNNGWNAIYLVYSNYNTITNSTSYNNKYGISLYYSNNNILTNNTVHNNSDYGIAIYWGSYNTLINNTAYNNGYGGTYIDARCGVSVECWCSNNTIINNTISNNVNGIRIYWYSSSNTITNNIVSGNTNGILLRTSSDNNTIINNDVSDNNNGICLESSFNNTIYNNYFNNTNNAYDDSNNTWNISKTPGINIVGGDYIGGNYWHDYGGFDNDGDGIGDTNLPYNNSGLIQNGGDYLPLTKLTNVYVDDDFNSSTPGWQYDHFDVIQDGIDAVEKNGTVYVYNGTYYENVIVNKTIDLIGENRDTTVIDGGGNNIVICIHTNGVSITGFTITNSSGEVFLSGGIRIYRQDYTHISRCIIRNNLHGINMDNSSHNKIIDTYFINNTIGIISRNGGDRGDVSNYNTILNCNFSGNWFGIEADCSVLDMGNAEFQYNQIVNCSFYNSTSHGICIFGDEWDGYIGFKNNIFKGNTFKNNHNKGILMWFGSINNSFYLNSFINNGENVNTTTYNQDNQWDNGTFGNYWDDYIGMDSDGNGIGDIPYNISSSQQDHYPLMHPFGPPYAEFEYAIENRTVEFNASLSGDYDGTIVFYEWEFGDGENGTGIVVNHTYATNSTYNVTLTVTDDDGANDSICKMVNVTSSVISVDIPLTTGWNLITVPVENGYTAMTLSENITGCVSINRWDAVEQTYKPYIVGGPPGLDFPIEDGYGYFVDVSENDTLVLAGYRITDVSIPLEIGWNLIGWYHTYNTTASSLAENITGCVSINRWDAIEKTYKPYIVGGPPGLDFIITQGMGLFVDVSVESTWHGEG